MEGKEQYSRTTYERAKKRVDELKGFYWHLAIYIIFNSFNFLNYFVGKEASDHMELWVVLLICFAWGVGLALHAWHVFGMHVVFGADWEARKIKEFMEEDA